MAEDARRTASDRSTRDRASGEAAPRSGEADTRRAEADTRRAEADTRRGETTTRDRVSTVLVGRADALDLAVRRWGEATGGPAQLLLVAGEAGIGKTRLLAEIPGRLDAGIQIVDAATFPRDADAPGAVVLALADGLRRAGLPQAEVLRARLLVADDGEGHAPDDRERRRRVLVGDLGEIIQSVLKAQPLLIRIEDLHWADELSLEVLERVISVRVGRGLIVATYRSDEVGPSTVLGRWRARLLAKRVAEEVRLSRLDADGTAAMIEAVTGSAPSSELLEALHERSDGIPLYIEELLADRSGRADEVPDSVVIALAARAESLDDASREILDAGSVIGRSFDLDLLAAVVDGGRAHVTDVDAALQRLVAAQLVVVRDELFVFRHALICDAVYGQVQPLRRRTLHASVARAAERAGLSESYVSYHFERAHNAPEAHRHALAGARAAAHVSAHREAAELFARAQRNAPVDSEPERQASLHAEIAVELAAVDDNVGARANLESAIRLHRELGDEASAARLVPALMAALHLLGADLQQRTSLATEALGRFPHDEDVSAALYSALSAAYMLDRRLDEALDFGERAVALLTDVDLSARAEIDPTLASVLVFAGRGDEGWPMLENSISLSSRAGLEAQAARAYRMLGSSASMLVDYDRADHWLSEGIDYSARTERWNDYFYMESHRAHVQWARGRTEPARATARDALANGRGITTRVTALTVLGYVALADGQPGPARSFLDDALVIAEQLRELQRLSPVLWGLAEAALIEGDPQAAAGHCESGLAKSQRVLDAAYLFPFVVTGTRAYLSLRDTGLAHEWLRRCTELLLLRRIPGTLPALDHAAGLIALAEGQTGAARALLERASVRWAELDRAWEGTWSLVDLARCAVRSRRPAEAARLVESVQQRGSELLRSAARDVGAADAGAGPLTIREGEVAALVASGLTNREIAARLTISPKTASAHVEHILAKLGAARRAEIASWFARQ